MEGAQPTTDRVHTKKTGPRPISQIAEIQKLKKKKIIKTARVKTYCIKENNNIIATDVASEK